MAATKRKAAINPQRATIRRVRVAPYVVPRLQPRNRFDSLTVPTRWVKFVVALFLLPICAALTQTFFTAFTRATLVQRLWAGEEFWFFSLGALLWVIAFFGLPRPVIVYVFGHELTHAMWVWIMGGRVSRFRVGADGGHIVTNRTNFWIALAPYVFPLYSIITILVFGGLSLFYDMQPYSRVLYALIGITWAFHFTFTCWMIPKNQTDLSDHGTFFSLVVIYLVNLLLLCAMLIVASPQTTFAGFAADLLNNVGNFSQAIYDFARRLITGERS